MEGNILPEDIDCFISHGANLALGKPVIIEKIHEVLENILDSKA